MVLPYSNLQLKHQNPGAEKPLILPVHVICNTSDEQLHENIRINTRRPNPVLQARDAHEGIAVLCGSGPSLQDSLDDIREWANNPDAAIFAMNGAASYLAANGIIPDYQVIIDAREETAQLVGPAEEHLFASQVHPACFDKAPDATVWNLQIQGIDELMPDGYPAHVQIGGAASVGNTATCLAYAMGYRNLQIYGYDSSHRNGNGHAFHQKMNDGDPCAFVSFCGKDYLVSLTMKLQAEKFQETARDLKQLGCHIDVHGDGLLPAMFNMPKEVLSEQEKYERMWAIPGYRQYSPGEEAVQDFLNVIDDDRSTLLDIGCGTGRAGVKLKEAGYAVTLMDLTDNSRDYAALTLPFIQHDITKAFPIKADYGYCADVMEHIPTDQVPAVLRNIMRSTKLCFFQISTQPDHFGSVINQDLHLTVQPKDWWIQQINACGGIVVHAREQEGNVQLKVVSIQ
jgi:SAM-dependent methyltransferase